MGLSLRCHYQIFLMFLLHYIVEIPAVMTQIKFGPCSVAYCSDFTINKAEIQNQIVILAKVDLNYVRSHEQGHDSVSSTPKDFQTIYAGKI